MAALDFLGQSPPRDLAAASVRDVWEWAFAAWSFGAVPGTGQSSLPESGPVIPQAGTESGQVHQHLHNAVADPAQKAGNTKEGRQGRRPGISLALWPRPPEVECSSFEIAIANGEISLFGEKQAERVDVGETDCCPAAVDDGHLGVEEASPVFVDSDPNGQRAL